MADGANLLDNARAEAYAMPLDQIDLSVAERFRNNTLWPFFERIRAEDPVHYTAEHEFGPYWSVTKYNDIMAVDTNHAVFSSEGGITIFNEDEEFPLPMFIAMDPPKHDAQRKAVSPIVAPHNLANFEPIIRERVCQIFDELPVGETFDWGDCDGGIRHYRIRGSRPGGTDGMRRLFHESLERAREQARRK